MDIETNRRINVTVDSEGSIFERLSKMQERDGDKEKNITEAYKQEAEELKKIEDAILAAFGKEINALNLSYYKSAVKMVEMLLDDIQERVVKKNPMLLPLLELQEKFLDERVKVVTIGD